MVFNNKERRLKKLQKKVKNNSKKISFYRNWSPVLMILFVVLVFLMFYFNLEKIYVSIQSLLIVALSLIFLTLSSFHFTILKKKKENKVLDQEIYNLLEL